MSPEQCQGLASDHRSDLFSAGVVLYELLTGEKPFTGSAEMITYQICHEAPRPPSKVAQQPLPPAIDGLVMTALAKEPERTVPERPRLSFGVACRRGRRAERRSVGAGGDAGQPRDRRSLPPLPAAWDEATLATVERELARVVGPVAKVLVRNAALHAHDAAELYSLLGAHITDREERRRFVELAPAVDSTGRATSGTGPHAPGARGASGSHPPPLSSLARAMSDRPPLSTQPLEAPFIDQTTQRLAVYLGPIARIVARKAAEQARTRDEFLQIVAGHMGTQDRRSFMRAIEGEPD